MMSPTDSFRLSDYDCVGFDLDNTLCEYRIGPLVQTVYDLLADYLVDERGYPAARLRQPVDFGFVQRGLILDAERGNVLKIDGGGRVLRAAHGTRFMSAADVVAAYGPRRTWSVTDAFVRNFVDTWNGPAAERIRPLLDFFDAPASLAFARCVDAVDDAGPCAAYTVWPDVLAGLVHMYTRGHFASGAGGYFPRLVSAPSLYYNRCPGYVLDWLRELRNGPRKRVVFLVSGSHVDYADFSATQSLGADWRELFDVAVFYARKPGFFTENRPFLATDERLTGEREALPDDALRFGRVYSQGNWAQLLGLFRRETGKPDPKCLYVGDNVLQDVVAPSRFSGLDTVAVVEEMKVDGGGDANPDNGLLRPNKWSSYLADCDEGVASVWTSFIGRHATLCVPSVRSLAEKPLDFQFKSFAKGKSLYSGFFPFLPNSLHKIVK